jgi:hypothetical protein
LFFFSMIITITTMKTMFFFPIFVCLFVVSNDISPLRLFFLCQKKPA